VRKKLPARYKTRATLTPMHGVKGATPMNTLKNLLNRVVRDEAGGEVLEYALIAGLIVVAAIAVIGSVGTKVLARWTSLNNGM
jgi:Flp pilus assembly pilin Flp